MSAAKRYTLAFALGMLTPLLFVLWLGGETIAQGGLRLAAIERGVSEASRHWDFVAAPAAEAREPLALNVTENTPAMKKPAPRRR